MLLGLARRRTAGATAAAAAGTAWHATRDSVAFTLPPTFLCPILDLPQPATVRRRLDRRSPRASTSYAPQQPARSEGILRRQKSEAVPGARLRCLGAFVGISTSSPSALSDLDVASKRGAVRSFSSTNRTRQQENRSQAVTKYPPMDDLPPTMSVKDLQELTLTRAVVRDIFIQPIELFNGEDDVLMLHDAADTYLRICNQECAVLETLVPELASVFIHFGHGDEAVKLLQRYCACFVAAGRSVSLLAWRDVLVKAFERGDYDLTVQLIETGASRSASSDDWAAYARFEALLRIVEHHLPTVLQRVDMVDRFWEEFEKADRTAPIEMFTALIKSQARRGNAKGLRQTVKALQRHGHVIGKRIWRFMIQVHPRGRKFAVLRDLPAELGLNSDQVLRELIYHFSKMRDLRRAALALRCFGVNVSAKASEIEGWKPQIASVLPLIRLTGQLSMPNAMLRMISFLVQLEIDKDITRMMGQAVDSLCASNRPQDALALSLQLMGAHPSSLQETGSTLPMLPIPAGRAVVVSSRRACGIAMRACAAYKSPTKAVALTRVVLRELFRREPKASGKTVSELVGLFRRTVADAHWSLFASQLNMIARELGTQADVIARFVAKVHSLGVVDEFIIEAGSKLPGGAEEAHESLNWVRQSDQLNPAVLSVPTSKKAKSTRRSTEAFDGRRFNRNPNVHLSSGMSEIAYAMRLRMFSVILRDHASAMAILRHMQLHRVKPNGQHIAIIVEGLVLSNQLEEAEKVCEFTRRNVGDFDNDHRISSAFVRAHARRGDWGEVTRQLQSMRQRGMKISPALAASVKSKYEHFWAGLSSRERVMAKKDVTKLTERTLKQLAQGALRSVMDATLTQEEQELIRARTSNPTSTLFDKHSTLFDKHSEHAEKSSRQMVSVPEVRSVTILFQSMFQAKKYDWAGVYMSKALDAGLVADSTLRSVLRRAFGYMRVMARREGLDPENMLDKTPHKLEVPKRLARVRDSLEHLPMDDARRAEEFEIARQEISAQQRRYTMWQIFTPLLPLFEHNCRRAAMNSADLLARQKDQHASREAFYALLQDAFVNGTLVEEARQMNNESPLAVPLFWQPAHEDIEAAESAAEAEGEEEPSASSTQTNERKQRESSAPSRS